MRSESNAMSEKPAYKGPAYPTEAHGSIPAFTSYEEEAAFWDSHDFTDFKDETRPVKVRATRGLSDPVQVRFDTETNRELEAQARTRGVKKSTLIRMWVLERLQEERHTEAS